MREKTNPKWNMEMKREALTQHCAHRLVLPYQEMGLVSYFCKAGVNSARITTINITPKLQWRQ